MKGVARNRIGKNKGHGLMHGELLTGNDMDQMQMLSKYFNQKSFSFPLAIGNKHEITTLHSKF